MTLQLEDELRTTLVAHADDVTPDPSLAHVARGRAVRLRRQKRLQVGAGALVVTGAVALVPLIAALGPADVSAPPIRPGPSVSPGPVPEIVLKQAAETHALLGTPTTIVDGARPDVLTVPVANKDTVQGGINQLVQVSRAAGGGYVVKLQPNLPGDMDPADADPISVSFVGPDGRMTLLGHPTKESHPVVSPDGALVAFESDSALGRENLLVVTDLAGRPLHQHDMAGPQDVVYLTVDGLWFTCARLTCPRAEDNLPHYWDFASDTVIPLQVSPRMLWVAQSGDQMVLVDGGQTSRLYSFDVSSPASPTELWSTPTPVYWAKFDGSGTRLLVTDAGKDRAVLLDAATGQELDHVRLTPVLGYPTWTPNNRWLAYGQSLATADIEVMAFTPGASDSLSLTSSTYPPYEIHAYRGPSYALIGSELPPPVGSGG